MRTSNAGGLELCSHLNRVPLPSKSNPQAPSHLDLLPAIPRPPPRPGRRASSVSACDPAPSAATPTPQRARARSPPSRPRSSVTCRAMQRTGKPLRSFAVPWILWSCGAPLLPCRHRAACPCLCLVQLCWYQYSSTTAPLLACLRTAPSTFEIV